MGRFLRAFGPASYHNPGRYATSDGVVPYGLFFLLLDTLGALTAEDELRQALGHQLGQALAEDPKHSKTKAAMRRVNRRAFPIVTDDLPPGDDE